MFDLSFENLSYLFIGLVTSVIILLAITKIKTRYPYFSRGTLLTPAEQKFYKVLKAVTKNKYDVACKVRLADIINCSDINWRRGYGPKISSKHIDFVLFDPVTTDILLCIELDDKSHERKDRQIRDDFVNKALKAGKTPLVRFLVAWGYDMARLEVDITRAIQS